MARGQSLQRGEPPAAMNCVPSAPACRSLVLVRVGAGLPRRQPTATAGKVTWASLKTSSRRLPLPACGGPGRRGRCLGGCPLP